MIYFVYVIGRLLAFSKFSTPPLMEESYDEVINWISVVLGEEIP